MTTEVSEPRTKLLTSAYSAAASGRLDEAFTDNGTLREHWRYVLSSLEGLGAGGLDERAQKIARILRDDGATYNVHTDPLGPLRTTWSLDPIPMVLDSAQWQTIEAGLLERAELLNLMLRDLYGPRELLTRRVLPPELVFSNPGFLRACHGAQLAGEHDLILHATDLVRTADGSFCAVADSTQSPAGAGYALENRLVMSRVFPSLFRESQVHRLALFFRTLRSTLDRLAHSHTDEPRVVVLTPGSFNDNYFEHTFLANYLGYALVQGSDLTCRDGYLWVKSVGGLERVDAVVRRVEDSLCDPVELRGDSRLGVAGLLDVARNGNVIIANPIGTGVLENPGLLKYFGALGQHYLGREPRLPSVQTWWCGEPADFAYVRDHLDELVIKSTFASAAAQTYVPAQMSKDDTQQLLRRIAERPNRFAAQPLLDMSQTPTWRDQRLAASPMALRGFCVAADGAYQVLPGGLVRVGAREELLVGGAPAGSLSKDVWVLASEPERQVSLLSDTGGVERLDVPQSSLPSRVVENLFWMGRYAERAEYAIRLLRTVFMQLNPELNLGGQLTSEAQTALLRAVTLLTGTGPGFLANDTELLAKPESELLSVILDSSRPGSVTSNVLSMLRASVDVQEELSADTRRVLNDIRDELGQLEASLAGGLSSAPEEALDPLITYLSSLAGLSNESMMHGMGWRFAHIGRRIERTVLTATLLEAVLHRVYERADESLLLSAVLLSVENLIDYRRYYRAQPEAKTGIQLLMLNRSNPRSLMFQLERLSSHLEQLPRAATGFAADASLPRSRRATLEASTMVQLADLDQLLSQEAKTGKREHLSALLARVQHLMIDTTNALSDQYFDHASAPQQLVEDQRSTEL